MNENVEQNETASPPEPEFKTARGEDIKDLSKYPGELYRGVRVYFCTQACLDVFLQDPDPLMAGEVEQPA